MKTLLIIDDEGSICETLKILFKSVGFNVLTADDGNKGIALFKENQIDLVIVDILMPGKDGLETILELKSLLPEIIIIAISGGGRLPAEDYLDTARKLGAKYTFEKPFNRDDLLRAINESLKDIEA